MSDTTIGSMWSYKNTGKKKASIVQVTSINLAPGAALIGILHIEGSYQGLEVTTTKHSFLEKYEQINDFKWVLSRQNALNLRDWINSKRSYFAKVFPGIKDHSFDTISIQHDGGSNTHLIPGDLIHYKGSKFIFYKLHGI